LLHQRLLRINSEIATSIVPVLLPRERCMSGGPAARAVALITKAMSVNQAEFGVWIDEDGSAARVFDIRGRLLPVGDVAAELIQEAVHQRPRSTIAVDWTLADQLNERALRGRDIVRSGGTAEAMAITMADHSATIGVDSSGRMWLPGPTVACDALVMLARMLKAFRNSGRL
jgi:hypothetical protein